MCRYILVMLLLLYGYIFAENIVTQYELNIDALNHKNIAQENLKKLTNAYASKLNSAQKILFISSENNWKKYIHSYCKFTTSASVDGSIHGMVVNNCLTKQNVKHIKIIKALMQCKEGDLQCVLI